MVMGGEWAQKDAQCVPGVLLLPQKQQQCPTTARAPSHLRVDSPEISELLELIVAQKDGVRWHQTVLPVPRTVQGPAQPVDPVPLDVAQLACRDPVRHAGPEAALDPRVGGGPRPDRGNEARGVLDLSGGGAWRVWVCEANLDPLAVAQPRPHGRQQHPPQKGHRRGQT